MPRYDGQYVKNNPTYLDKPEQYENPKEAFKQVVSILDQSYGQDPFSLIDVGCASGGFLHYAHSKLNLTDSVGVDISDELLEQGRTWVPKSEFINDSILDPQHPFSSTFDVCTCLGTMGAFDEGELALRNLFQYVRPGGILIVWDFMNDHPVDIQMRYRNVGEHGDSKWHPGFSMLSVSTFETVLKELDPGISIQWNDFSMPFDIPQQDNPMRAWTTQVGEKERAIMVGTGQVLPFKIMVATRSSA